MSCMQFNLTAPSIFPKNRLYTWLHRIKVTIVHGLISSSGTLQKNYELYASWLTHNMKCYKFSGQRKTTNWNAAQRCLSLKQISLTVGLKDFYVSAGINKLIRWLFMLIIKQVMELIFLKVHLENKWETHAHDKFLKVRHSQTVEWGKTDLAHTKLDINR